MTHCTTTYTGVVHCSAAAVPAFQVVVARACEHVEENVVVVVGGERRKEREKESGKTNRETKMQHEFKSCREVA